MTDRITSGQRKQLGRLAADAVDFDGLTITKEAAQRVIAQGGRFQEKVLKLILKLAVEYFILLSDEEAQEWLRRRAGKDEQEAKRHILGYRRGTQEHEVSDSVPCHVLVCPDVTLKQTIPTVGPCVEDFRYLQTWNFPDPPTQESLFSLIPALLPDSASKNVAEQRELLAQLRRRLELPDNGNHLTGFGSVTHLSGAALTYKAAGRDIFAGKVARTEICIADGDRLLLRWDAGRLYCVCWSWYGGNRFGGVGVLACGVEPVMRPAKPSHPTGPRRSDASPDA